MNANQNSDQNSENQYDQGGWLPPAVVMMPNTGDEPEQLIMFEPDFEQNQVFCEHGNVVKRREGYTHCWFHCYELIPENIVRFCYECHHAWDAESLLREYNWVLREVSEIEDVEPGVSETDVDRVYSCPLCGHDW